MAIELPEDQRRAFLRDEYLFLQGQYEDFDKRSLTIKGWVSTGAIAALAIALNASTKHAVFIPFIVAIIVAVIWYFEVYWKLFQYAFADRIRLIEAYFRNDPDVLVKGPEPFQIYHWGFRSYARDEPIFDYEAAARPRSRKIRSMKIAFAAFVCLPYIPILLLCIASFLILLTA